jgi:energy-coupling factor transport system ATP-binding protein
LLLGASGAGKSTFVSALAGVLGGDDDGEQAGELLVDGVAPDRARGRVGLVLQDPDSQVILGRVGDDVAFGCENLGVPRDEIWRRVGEALDAVGLDVGLAHSTSELSGGQKQRLALAGVIAMRPGLLLLDEPTANLDPDGVREIRDAVARIVERTGSTLIVIEHRVEVWQSLVDRVIILAPTGGILADGSPEAVLAENGTALAASGVWVPGISPAVPPPTGVDQLCAGRGGADAGADPRLPGSRALHTENVSIGRRAGAVLASGLGLELGAGRLVAITGANGSGKSTLGLTLGGLLRPLAGSVVVAPEIAADASVHPIEWKSRQLLSRIGSVFQNPEHQFLAATVREELAVGPRALGLSPGEVDARVDELLERLRLSQLAKANPFTLSGGEKRRLSVGTAIATRPSILVLDEPTFGQDSRTWSELVFLLAEVLSTGTAVAAITHDAAFVAALATATLELGSARVRAAP